MSISEYRKAIAAAISAVVVVLSQTGVALPWFDPELVSGVAAIVGTVLVYAIPNVPRGSES